MAKKTNFKTYLVMAVLFVGMAPAVAAGGTIYVDVNTLDNNDGSSWADAYKYLQDALAVAVTDDEIWVAEGIYKPDANTANPGGTADRTETFQLINGMAIYGGFAGGESSLDERDVQQYETILSGDIGIPVDNWDNSHHVVTGSGTNNTAILDGFTITAGNADGPKPNNLGGGMFNDNSSPTLINCTFSGNTAVWWGGAMCNYSDSSPVLTNCTFSSNSAGYQGGGVCNYSDSNPVLTNCTFGGNYAYWHGGGMYNYINSSPTLTNCTFSGNSARGVGGGMDNMHESNPILTGCTFSGNSAGSKAGGMANTNSSNPVLTNCTFARNYSKWHGGGIGNRASSPRVTNCTFSGNYAHYGGAMHSDSGSSPTLTNCTFTGNTAIYGGGMYNVGDGGPILTNCILWGDTPEEIYVSSGMLLLTYCDVEGGWDGERNIDTDPCFVDADSNDYHLLPDSPCIDAGDNTAVPPDTTDLDGDGNTTEPLPFDLDGNPRIVDGNDDGNSVVDMGAYEFFVPAIIQAIVDIDPDTLNLKSKGQWITCYIWPPEGYDVADIDPNSVWLEEVIAADWMWFDEEEQVAMAKFSRSEVQDILYIGQVELTISGELTDGTLFEGTDVIRVIDKGRRK